MRHALISGLIAATLLVSPAVVRRFAGGPGPGFGGGRAGFRGAGPGF